jgi:hypothetical protein
MDDASSTGDLCGRDVARLGPTQTDGKTVSHWTNQLLEKNDKLYAVGRLGKMVKLYVPQVNDKVVKIL